MATSQPIPTPPSGPHPSAIQTRLPQISFKLTDVPPSQYVYMQDEDFFLLTIMSNAAGGQVVARYRYLTPQGEIKVGEFKSGILVAYVITFPFFQIGEGWLLSLELFTLGPLPLGAWTFCQVLIARGPQSVVQYQGMIWEGYIPSNVTVGWPGQPSQNIWDSQGTLISITGTAPAAGAEITETIPNHARRTILSVRATLTTSATVANRFPGLQVDDGVNLLYQVHTTTAQLASLAASYHLAPGSPFFNDAQGNTILPFPALEQVKKTFDIKTHTVGLQAGDQWSAPQYLALEWGLWDP